MTEAAIAAAAAMRAVGCVARAQGQGTAAAAAAVAVAAVEVIAAVVAEARSASASAVTMAAVAVTAAAALALAVDAAAMTAWRSQQFGMVKATTSMPRRLAMMERDILVAAKLGSVAEARLAAPSWLAVPAARADGDMAI